MNRATIAIILAVFALGLAALPLVLGGGELGVTNFDDLTLSGDLIVGDDTTLTDDLTVTGDTTFSGTVTGAISNDLNAALMIIDADADTTLRAAVDDIAVVAIGAATGTLGITTGSFRVGNGANSVALNGEDAYVEGTFEVDGTSNFAGVATFGADPVLGTGVVSAGEVADAVRYVDVPLRSFIDCQTDAGADLGFDTTADALADFVNSATDGTGFVIRFDDTGATEDQSMEVCSQFTVPADYASGGAFKVRALKDAHTAATEVLNVAVSVNGAALQAAGTTTTSTASSTAYTVSPTIASLAADDSVSFYLSITSDSTMNDLVDVAAVSFFYTATQ